MKLIEYNRQFVFYVLIGMCCLIFSGCETINPEEEILNDYSEAIDFDIYPESKRAGVYHKVNKGETLWRIAKAYRIPIKDIIRTNNIPDVAEIETNQLVFIPGADVVQEIIVEDVSKANEFIWPLEGKVIKYFNQLDGNRINRGLNIKASPGEKVRASRSGRVVFSDFLPGYGQTVILDHGDGYHSIYAHNAVLLVNEGEHITKRTPVAQIGMDGRLAFTHFQIRHNASVENPIFYLP